MPKLYPLTVSVTHNEKLVRVGGLIFIPESGDWGGLVVNASANPDGTFTAQTSRITDNATIVQPGIPAGRYFVVYHPLNDGQKVGLEYQFPEPITVEAKDNLVTVALPEPLPSNWPKPKDEKQEAKPETKPASKTGE